MKKQKNMSLLAAFMTTAMSIVPCNAEPIEKWQQGEKTEQAHTWQKREFLAPEECCPLVTPVCPCCDPENPGENCFVVTNNGDDENEPTLRAAISAANTSDATECDPFSIIFNIPAGEGEEGLKKRSCASSKPTVCVAREDDVRTIFIDSTLPEIAKPVCINGFTQPGSDEERRIITIQIDGNGERSDGLVLQPTAMGSTIKGVSIGNFRTPPFALIRVLASRSKIAGNNVGLKADGITHYGPGAIGGITGIVVDTGSDITIGGLNFQDKNVISSINIAAIINTSSVTFVGNFVGTDVTGTVLLANRLADLNVNGDSNIIGCNGLYGRNIFTGGFFGSGIGIFGNNNCVTNCFIGVSSTGTQLLASSSVGILLQEVSNTTIKHCLIAGYRNSAVAATSCSSIKISHCFIGTDITGNCALGGDVDGAGIFFEDSQCNEVSSNLISYKDGAGIRFANSSNNLIQANYIGTNAAGTAPIGEGPQGTGIALVSTDSTQGELSSPSLSPAEELEEVKKTKQTESVAVGTTKNLIKLNLISGNKIAGISLQGARKNKIVHNNIGTDAWGVCCIPNGIDIQFVGEVQPNTIECNVFCRQQTV